MRVRIFAALFGPMLFLVSLGFSSALVFSQSGGNTTRAGYAIVTTVFGSVNNLQVIETFGLSNGLVTAQGSTSPAILTNRANLLVSVDTTVQRNTGVALANPGSTNANVALSLLDAGGRAVANGSIVVPATRQVARFVTELLPGALNLVQPFDGTLVLTSDSAVGITALRFRGPGFGSLPLEALIPSPNPLPLLVGGSVGGPPAVLLPHIVAGGGWASQIAASNVGNFTMIVRIDLFGQDGSPLTIELNGRSGSSFTNVEIPAGGVVVLSTASASSGSTPF